VGHAEDGGGEVVGGFAIDCFGAAVAQRIIAVGDMGAIGHVG